MTLDAERFRTRSNAVADDLTRLLPPPGASSLCVVAATTTLNAYPTKPFSFYACVANTVLGEEVEGGPAVTTPATSLFFALNIGSAIPPVGTSIIASYVGNRWVFRYDG